MKYFVEGVVRCMAGIEVDAESYDDAAKVAKMKCLEADPLLPPQFMVTGISPVDVEDDEVDDEEDFDDADVKSVKRADIASKENISDLMEVIKSAFKTEAVGNKCKGCDKANGNKNKCTCKGKSSSCSILGLYPLFDWFSGGDEWDFV